MRRLLLLAVVAVGLVAGCSTTQTTPAAEAPPVNGDPSVALVAAPAQIRIPRLTVTDEVVPVGLEQDGSLEVPKVTETGWYTGSPKPGETGPSLIAGHVNYAGVVGAFAHLGDLAAGDDITVTDADGKAHVFTVYDVTQFPKTEYSKRILGLLAATPGPELRLVTCSGTVSDHEYSDNTVVSARLKT